MASRNIEFRVGILIIVSLAILVGAIIWVQGYRFGQKNYTFSVMFEEVGSLAKGDPVMVSGIRMGKVIALGLTEEGVEAIITLSNEVVLRKDARFTVKNIGLMGERFVAVSTGMSEELLDLSKPVPGSYDTGIPEVMGMMGEMITELRNLVLALKETIASEDNLDKLTATIANFEDLSHSLSDYFQRNRKNLDKAARNFLDASADLKKLVSGNAGRADSVMMRVDDASQKVTTIVTDLEYVAKTAREFADNLNRGDGTLQMLVDDRRLYDDLRKTADNLDDLITDIRANPKKYIQLKVELF
ncbi:MAG: MCE family protein [Candidatus Zixiibacteriota bacterium]|nr:MAG: MCE family protein [candidate division Zixibacteria bacterium]